MTTTARTTTERHLFGPGPCNPYPEATAALAAPLLGHLDPVFLELMDETCDLLRLVWGTDNRRTLPLSATGSAGMEAAFVNLVSPGDVVVVAVNGLFGKRMVEVASRHGAEVVAVEHEWGQPVDVERVLAAHPSPAIIAAVHAETSTGVRSDVAGLGAGKGDALLVVDAVTSIGGIELRADDWGIDVGYAGTQKCLGVAPGLAPFTINDRAFARRVERPSSWYLDLGSARRLRRRGVRLGSADLPPHRSDRDGREPARRPAPDRVRGARGRLGPARRGRTAAPGGAGRARASSCSPPRDTACPS